MCPTTLADESGRGFIIPIGGGEDRVKEMQIHRKFVELSGGADAYIVVIPTAILWNCRNIAKRRNFPPRA